MPFTTPAAAALLIRIQSSVANVANISQGPTGAATTTANAGYGTASRLEYLLVPLVFGFGGPLVAMVGTCIGAGLRERALRAAWIGAALSAGLTEAIGLAASVWPHAWLSLFGSCPAFTGGACG